MKSLKIRISKAIKRYKISKRIINDPYFDLTEEKIKQEMEKRPFRSDIINYLIRSINGKSYLEIGVREPSHNFNKIDCENKFSVDPNIEFGSSKVDFKMTSDEFFEQLSKDELEISSSYKFDLIFIDGMHTAEQVEKDIINSMEFLNNEGYLVLHDCNPPTEFHQREDYLFRNSPARGFWNGTTWKSFYKFRLDRNYYSICFDTDWGIGIISKKRRPLFNNLKENENKYYSYRIMNEQRDKHLNLVEFENWKKLNE